MLNALPQQPGDALLALIKLHDLDPRPTKIDLGVGVYRTSQGSTPVFGAIKVAEARLVETQTTKSYLGPEGDVGFVRALIPHIFGTDSAPVADERIDGMQTPGGTGGVRLAIALAHRAGVRRLLMGVPSWPNHAQIAADIGIKLDSFTHSTPAGDIDMAALRAALATAGPGDAILLHGCCHNPTGVDYDAGQWAEIATLLTERGVLPILDLAYQGLGAGMAEDAAGVRAVLATVPEALVAYSCDKNFGLYRDRVGALYMMCETAAQVPVVVSNAWALARANWSMPPDHGAAAVRIVLEDEALIASWQDELTQMRQRIRQVRDGLAAAGHAGSIDLSPIARQSGMFSILPLNPAQVLAIRERHGVYMAGSGRINIAGLTVHNIDAFVAALADVAG